MSYWTTLFGGTVIKDIGEAIDNNVTTDEERGKIDFDDASSARLNDKPIYSPGVINQLVDAFNRLLRPGVTVWLIGGFSGWWSLPDESKISPLWFTIFLTVITFWFGGRMLVQDLPRMLIKIIELRRK